MGVDTPDWGGNYNSPDFYPLDDMAELAVRLGSIHSYDRRGNVVWYTDFSKGLGVITPTTQGAQSSINLSAAKPDYSGFTALMAVDNNSGDFARLNKIIQLPLSNRIGVSSLFVSTTGSPDITLNMSIRTGAFQYSPIVKYDQTANKIYIFNSAGAYVEVPVSFGISAGSGVQDFLKLVVNVSTGYYERLIFGSRQVNLTTYAMSSAVQTAAARIDTSLYALFNSGVDSATHIYSWTITANEPEN